MPKSQEKIRATADTFVHFLFASPGNEDILLSFVNAVQGNAGLSPVKTTKVLNPFNPKTFLTDKRSIIDIKAVAKNDRTFVIEFQVADHISFVNRALFYWAKTYCAQLKEGDGYEKLAPVAMMIVTCFLLFGELPKLHNTFWLTAQDAPEFVLTEDMQMHTVELVRDKIGQLPAVKQPLRDWLEFFYYANKKSEAEMKVLLQNSDPTVQQAYDAYVRFNQDEELRQLEENRQQYLHDINTEIEAARREGVVIGREEGKEEGRAEGRVVAKAEATIQTLTKRFKTVPQSLEEQIAAMTDLAKLERLADFAYDCKSLDEFAKSVK